MLYSWSTIIKSICYTAGVQLYLYAIQLEYNYKIYMLYSWSTKLIQMSPGHHIYYRTCVFDYFCPEDGGTVLLQNVFNHHQTRLCHSVEDHILSCEILRFYEKKRVV